MKINVHTKNQQRVLSVYNVSKHYIGIEYKILGQISPTSHICFTLKHRKNTGLIHWPVEEENKSEKTSQPKQSGKTE